MEKPGIPQVAVRIPDALLSAADPDPILERDARCAFTLTFNPLPVRHRRTEREKARPTSLTRALRQRLAGSLPEAR